MRNISSLSVFIVSLSLIFSGAASAATIGLTASASGTTVTTSVVNAPGINTNDVIAVHSNVTNSRVAWCYLNGTLSLPSKPLSSGTCTFTGLPVGGIVVYYDEYGTNTGGVTLASVDLTLSTTTQSSSSPVITSQPANTTVVAGQPVALAVSATGSGLSYQWYVNGVAISGAKSANYSIAATTPSSAGTYTVAVANAAGSVTSSAVQLIITSSASASGTTIPPASELTDSQNNIYTLSGGFIFRNGVKDPYANSVATLLYYKGVMYQQNTSNMWYSWNGSTWIRISADPRGTVVLAAPVITAQPQSISASAGQSVTFSVVASGSNLTYQWEANGAAIAGASASTYTIHSVNSANAGSYAVTVSNPSGSVTSSAATLSMPTTVYNGRVKWNPGHYMMVAGPGASQWNIDTLAKYDHSNIKGFAGLYVWNQFENNTPGQYDFSAIVSDFNYLQSKIPGAHFAIGVAAYQNYLHAVPNVSTLKVSGATPNYILNDSGTYGAGPPGASQSGYGLSFYEPGNNNIYGYVASALWNQNVMTRYIAFFQALANASLPLNGVQYTVDTNPLVEYVFDWGPDDMDMTNNPLAPKDFSTDAWNQQWLRRMPAMSASFPHTNVGLMLGYGGGGPGSDQLTLLEAERANRIALTSTDIPANCVDSDFHCTWAQNYFMGNSYNSAGWVAGGTPSFAGTMASMPTVQPEDYMYPNFLRDSGLTANTVPVVEAVCAVATTKLHASHIFWSSASESTFNPTKDWPAFILPGIQNCDIPLANQAYPYSH